MPTVLPRSEDEGFIPYDDLISDLLAQRPDLAREDVVKIAKDQRVVGKAHSERGAVFRPLFSSEAAIQEFNRKYVTKKEEQRLRRAIADSSKPNQSADDSAL